MHQYVGFRICYFKVSGGDTPKLPLQEGRPPPAPSAAAPPLLWPTSVLGPISPVPTRFLRLSAAPGPHGITHVTCWNVFDRTKHSEQKLGKKTVMNITAVSLASLKCQCLVQRENILQQLTRHKSFCTIKQHSPINTINHTNIVFQHYGTIRQHSPPKITWLSKLCRS